MASPQSSGTLGVQRARVWEKGTQKRGALVPPGGRTRIRSGSGQGGLRPTVPVILPLYGFHYFQPRPLSGAPDPTVQLPRGWAAHMISVSRPAPPANFLIPVNGPISHPVTSIRRRKSCLISPLLHPPPPLYPVSYQHWSFDLLNSHSSDFLHLYCCHSGPDHHHPDWSPCSSSSPTGRAEYHTKQSNLSLTLPPEVFVAYCQVQTPFQSEQNLLPFLFYLCLTFCPLP